MSNDQPTRPKETIAQKKRRLGVTPTGSSRPDLAREAATGAADAARAISSASRLASPRMHRASRLFPGSHKG